MRCKHNPRIQICDAPAYGSQAVLDEYSSIPTDYRLSPEGLKFLKDGPAPTWTSWFVGYIGYTAKWFCVYFVKSVIIAAFVFWIINAIFGGGGDKNSKK